MNKQEIYKEIEKFILSDYIKKEKKKQLIEKLNLYYQEDLK